MALQFPHIDGERCVHALSAAARCEVCVAVCPHQALALGADSLTFDEAACTGCGLCRSACPESAIAFDAPAFAMLVDQVKPRAFAACQKAGVGSGPGVVPCLHGVTEKDLGELAREGVALLVTAYGDCASCANATASTLAARISVHNRLAAARGSKALLEEAVLDARRWSALAAEVKPAHTDVDQGRRALFGLFLDHRGKGRTEARQPGGAAGGDVLYRYVPQLAGAACVGCDACARVCPHGAISVQRDAQGLAYHIDAVSCTGCGLCRDVCEHAAVKVAEMAPAGVTRVALREKRCAVCGVPFHMTDEDAGDASRCRVCRLRPRPGRLFDVRS